MRRCVIGRQTRQLRSGRRLVKIAAALGGGGGGARGPPGGRFCFFRGGNAEPVQIKTGISDGTTTEVLEGLGDNDRVITGQLNAPNTATSQQQGNPFGVPRRFP